MFQDPSTNQNSDTELVSLGIRLNDWLSEALTHQNMFVKISGVWIKFFIEYCITAGFPTAIGLYIYIEILGYDIEFLIHMMQVITQRNIEGSVPIVLVWATMTVICGRYVTIVDEPE